MDTIKNLLSMKELLAFLVFNAT